MGISDDEAPPQTPSRILDVRGRYRLLSADGSWHRTRDPDGTFQVLPAIGSPDSFATLATTLIADRAARSHNRSALHTVVRPAVVMRPSLEMTARAALVIEGTRWTPRRVWHGIACYE